MSYTKTNWKDGDVISAEKMNKIEQGIADAGTSGGSGGVLGVAVTYNDKGGTFSRTWQEIYDTMDNGGFVVIYMKDANGTIVTTVDTIECGHNDGEGYYVRSGRSTAMCGNPDEYPGFVNNSSTDE